VAATRAAPVERRKKKEERRKKKEERRKKSYVFHLSLLQVEMAACRSFAENSFTAASYSSSGMERSAHT
jgi:hypothetical protein